MARKKITALLGDDPVYSKQFGNNPKPVEADSPPSPEPNQQTEPVATPDAADHSGQKPPTKAKTKPKSEPKKPKPQTTPKKKSDISKATRAVHVRAAPKTEHQPGLEALAEKGLTVLDVIRLAGRRAIEKFELDPKYVKPEEAERLPSELSFRTMKTLNASTLDKLRDQADPLRLRSDAAVIQGQLEPLFWTELTALIKELRKQYS